MITKETIINAISYPEYRSLIGKLLSEGKTTGENQTPVLIDFTKLNVTRMNRLDKTTALYAELYIKLFEIKCKQIWLVIAEAWCGDCAQNIPVLGKIAAVSKGKVELKILLRDENPDVMNCALTNGAHSIPKLIALHGETLEMLGTWGPRPKPAQQIMMRWKENKVKAAWDDFEKELHGWYAHDRSETLQKEFIELVSKWRFCEEKHLHTTALKLRSTL